MPTTDQLLDLDPDAGVAQRQSWVSFDLLDKRRVKIGEVEPDWDQTIDVTHDNTRAIQRTLDGFRLGPHQGEAFDEVQARIRPWWRLENGATFPLGTFLFVDAARTRNTLGVAFDGRMGDLTTLLDEGSDQTFALRRGALLQDAVASIFERQGFTDWWVDPTGVQAGTEIGWRAGTSWLRIVNECAALMGCLPVSMDPYGKPFVKVPPDPLTTPPDVTYRDGRNIRANDIIERNDLLTAPNVFRVRETGARAAPIVGRYELPATAPNSYAKLGRWIYDDSDDQGMQSVAAANERARVRSITHGAVLEYATFESAPDPQDAQVGVAVVSFRDVRYLERRWKLPLREGADMGHDLARFYGEAA